MRKSIIDGCELAARNDHIDSFEKNVIEQDNCLKPSNATVNNKEEQFFKIGLEIDTTIDNFNYL